MTREITLTIWFCRENIVRKQKLMAHIFDSHGYVLEGTNKSKCLHIYVNFMAINVASHEKSCLYGYSYLNKWLSANKYLKLMFNASVIHGTA